MSYNVAMRKSRVVVMALMVLAISIFTLLTANSFVQAQSPDSKPDPGGGVKKICDSAGAAKGMCEGCMKGDPPEGVWTAIGCLHTDPALAAKDIFGVALGFGGIFILIQILMGAFGLITSSGNTAAVQKARDRIVNSVIALLFLVFSVTLLQIIGIQILKLPGMT